MSLGQVAMHRKQCMCIGISWFGQSSMYRRHCTHVTRAIVPAARQCGQHERHRLRVHLAVLRGLQMRKKGLERSCMSKTLPSTCTLRCAERSCGIVVIRRKIV
jgi:hypothetical protein